MDEFVVRLKGKPKEYMNRLIKKGYFGTKADIIRLGVIEISKKYLYTSILKEKLELIGKAVERDLKKARKNNEKFYTEEDLLKMFPHLKKLK